MSLLTSANETVLNTITYSRTSYDPQGKRTGVEAQNLKHERFHEQSPEFVRLAHYEDNDRSASKTDNRDGFSRMLDDIEAGRHGPVTKIVLVLNDVSRAFRNRGDYARLEALRAQSLHVIAYSHNIDTRKDTLTYAIWAEVSMMKQAELAAHIEDAKRLRIERCLPSTAGTPPIGWLHAGAVPGGRSGTKASHVLCLPQTTRALQYAYERLLEGGATSYSVLKDWADPDCPAYFPEYKNSQIGGLRNYLCRGRNAGCIDLPQSYQAHLADKIDFTLLPAASMPLEFNLDLIEALGVDLSPGTYEWPTISAPYTIEQLENLRAYFSANRLKYPKSGRVNGYYRHLQSGQARCFLCRTKLVYGIANRGKDKERKKRLVCPPTSGCGRLAIDMETADEFVREATFDAVRSGKVAELYARAEDDGEVERLHAEVTGHESYLANFENDAVEAGRPFAWIEEKLAGRKAKLAAAKRQLEVARARRNVGFENVREAIEEPDLIEDYWYGRRPLESTGKPADLHWQRSLVKLAWAEIIVKPAAGKGAPHRKREAILERIELVPRERAA
jgi:hypothetical protein